MRGTTDQLSEKSPTSDPFVDPQESSLVNKIVGAEFHLYASCYLFHHIFLQSLASSQRSGKGIYCNAIMLG